MTLISISIDLVGSTGLKNEIIKMSNGDETNIHRLYKDYNRLMLGLEKGFYNQLREFDQFDFEKLFLVKGIGDELWYLYDTEDMKDDSYEFNEIVFDILLACIIAISSQLLMISEDEIFFDEEMVSQNIKTKNIQLPVKIYVDKITDCEETSKERFNFFENYIPRLYSNEKGFFNPNDKEYIHIMQNLNIGINLETINDKVRYETRTDFIGYEIDRFFRVSKFALPGIVTFGKELIGSILYDDDEILNKVNDTSIYDKFAIAHGSDTVRRHDYFKTFKRTIPSSEMTGIGDEYEVYFIFLESMLDTWIKFTPDYFEDKYQKTREILKSVKYGGFHAQ